MAQGLITKLNMNQLRVFEATYRLKSMTGAANELFLTQSGVSQHIKSLESDLETQLFTRNRHQLYPTEAASALYQVCEKSFSDLGLAVEKIRNRGEKKLMGIIRIGVPTEFGNNVVIPVVSEWCSQFPDVQIDLVYGYGLEMRESLEKGFVDLAFIDALKNSARVSTQTVYRETLSLVASNEYMKKKGHGLFKEKLAAFSNLEFVEYQHQEAVLRMWFQHHYGKKNIPLKVKAWAVSVAGVARLIQQGMGAGIVPDHIIEQFKQRGEALHIFKGTKGAVKNEISLAWVKNKPLSPACEEFKKHALKKFTEI
jgi:DNA-binding transcriptional LysR family regulator